VARRSKGVKVWMSWRAITALDIHQHAHRTHLEGVDDACLDHVREDARGRVVSHVGVGVLEDLAQ
jgi:hypothetical protein